MDCVKDKLLGELNKQNRPMNEFFDVFCNQDYLDFRENSSDRIVELVNSTTKRRLGKLDAYTVWEYVNSRHIPPVSLLTALIFIEKLAVTNPPPSILKEITAVDLLIVSMMVASKYLHDDDTIHGVYNADWANDFNMDLKELNELEIKFISAMNWEFFVTKTQFSKFCTQTNLFKPTKYSKFNHSGHHLHHHSKSGRKFNQLYEYFIRSRKLRNTTKLAFLLITTYLTWMKNSSESFLYPLNSKCACYKNQSNMDLDFICSSTSSSSLFSNSNVIFPHSFSNHNISNDYQTQTNSKYCKIQIHLSTSDSSFSYLPHLPCKV